MVASALAQIWAVGLILVTLLGVALGIYAASRMK
jgi:hypothetical protein